MAVASYRCGTHIVGPKDIHAPKVSSLRAWYNAARKVIEDLPPWVEGMTNLPSRCYVDVELIHFNLTLDTDPCPRDLYIARRRHLR
jgi:hypothetical protein